MRPNILFEAQLLLHYYSFFVLIEWMLICLSKPVDLSVFTFFCDGLMQYIKTTYCFCIDILQKDISKEIAIAWLTTISKTQTLCHL